MNQTTESFLKKDKILSNMIQRNLVGQVYRQEFQRFIPLSPYYSYFSVLSPFQRFIPLSAFYPHFSVLSRFQRIGYRETQIGK